tara:strand:- start:182 stop:520 length:339 start_codon:yes stop_codon:yes gene_type:complete
MEVNNENILNSLIDDLCVLNDDLYYNIDHQLIHQISFILIKLNIYYTDVFLYNFIINKITNYQKNIWYKHNNIVSKRKRLYKIIDYIIDKKNINNFDIYLKYKIADYYLYKN